MTLLALEFMSFIMIVTKDVKKPYKWQLCSLHLWKEGDYSPEVGLAFSMVIQN